MKKLLIFTILISLFSCSRASLEKGGWVPPTYQKSKLMEISAAAFADNSAAEIKYYLDLKLLNNHESEWLIINFEDPQHRGNFLKKIYPIQLKQTSIKLFSDEVFGVQNFRSYEAKILLSKDKNGENIVDSMSQYVRAYKIPHKIVRYNMTPTTGKRFFVSGKKEDEEYKIKRYSMQTVKFFPDETKSKNFNVINAGFWIYYDIPKADQFTTATYNNSNLTVRYEYTLNRKKGFTDKVYQRAILENPEDRNKPFVYESVLDSNRKASQVFHAPLKNIAMGKKYKLSFEFYADEKRTKLIEKVTQDIRSPIDNTNGCIKMLPELFYWTPEPSKWMCKI